MAESDIRSPRSLRTTGPMPFVAISPERFIRAARGAARLLHITNGSLAADGIRRSGVAGKVTPSADILLHPNIGYFAGHDEAYRRRVMKAAEAYTRTQVPKIREALARAGVALPQNSAMRAPEAVASR